MAVAQSSTAVAKSAAPAAESAARRSHGSERYIAGLQRGRLLSATFALVGERGFEGVSARHVSERAGVSNRTFYQSFSDREDCFLAAFDYAVEGLERQARAGWEPELEWSARVRGAIAALLVALDREPAVRRLVFVEALAAGPRILARRAQLLESLAGVIDKGRADTKVSSKLPPLVAEGVVGGVFGVIHERVLEFRAEPLLDLLGSLMAMIVLPYRGGAAAARELSRPILQPPAKRGDEDGPSSQPLGAACPVDYRLTVRTQMALAAVAASPGLNNREVSEVIGLSDQGQISRMTRRLAEQGLIEDTQAHTKHLARAWRLTTDGKTLIEAHPDEALVKAQHSAGEAGKLGAKHGGRRGRQQKLNGTTDAIKLDFRLTALTHEVLTAVANLSERETNPSNREVAQAAKVKDEGQTSRLLRRLESHGMLQNTSSHPATGNAWRLTPRGQQLLSASSPEDPRPFAARASR
jgi:AcrR family transcriptional regulator/DNA-binding MarR family transcriptional regulator